MTSINRHYQTLSLIVETTTICAANEANSRNLCEENLLINYNTKVKKKELQDDTLIISKIVKNYIGNKMQTMKFKMHYWPIVTSGWIVLTFIVSYLISVLLEQVFPLFPYISETGAKPPASCVFGQMLNIAAALTAVTLYVRYRQIDFAIASGQTNLSKTVNMVAFWLGNIMALGISIVGNFQGNVEGPVSVLIVHIIGAFMAFGMGAIYMSIQTKISFSLKFLHKYSQFGVAPSTLYFRIFLTFCYYIVFLSTFIFGSFASDRFQGDQSTWWTSEDGGYGFHLASSFSEWLMVFVLLIYILTMIKEFKALEYEEISLTCKYISSTTDIPETR